MPEEEDPFKKVQEDLKRMELEGDVEAEKLEERFEVLNEDRVDTALPPVPEWNYKRPENKKSKIAEANQQDYKGLGYGLAIAYTLVGPLIVGWFVGMLIDKSRGTGNMWQTWLTIGGMILGFIGAIFIMSRSHSDNK